MILIIIKKKWLNYSKIRIMQKALFKEISEKFPSIPNWRVICLLFSLLSVTKLSNREDIDIIDWSCNAIGTSTLWILNKIFSLRYFRGR